MLYRVEKQQKNIEKQQRDAEELRRENTELRKLIDGLRKLVEDNINQIRRDLQPWMEKITACMREMEKIVFGPQDCEVPLGSD